jgi:hypothetical protein
MRACRPVNERRNELGLHTPIASISIMKTGYRIDFSAAEQDPLVDTGIDQWRLVVIDDYLSLLAKTR